MRKWHGNPWAILVTLALGFFMTLLDLTIVNIAMPNMIDKLGASLDAVLWVINGYVLVLAVLLITFGRLGDLLGQRNLFVAGVALFTVASLLCGLSQSAGQLIAARVLQGLGAALLMPQTMAIIIATFRPERRGTALGVWGAVAGVATITGPTLGGFLVAALDWRWIFFVNLPIGVIVLALAIAVIPQVRIEQRHRMDMTGVLVVTAGLFCLTFALTEGQRYDWNGWIIALFVAAAVFLVVFLAQQRRRQGAEPLVPFGLFHDRNFSVLNVVGAIVSIGLIGIYLPITIYLQSVLDFSALKAGLVMAPSSVVSMFLAPVAGRLSDRIGGKFILMTGLTLYAVGMGWVVMVAQVGTGWPAFLPGLVLAGLGMGGVFAPMSTEAMRNVAPRMAGAAAGVNNTIRQIGSVIGSAMTGAILQNRLAAALQDEAAKRAGGLPAEARAPFVAGFRNAARSGLEVGAGQTGAAQQVPRGLPQQVVDQVNRAAESVFAHGYVHAMKPTVGLPIAIMLIGAVTCFAVRGRTRASGPQPSETVEAAA